MKKILLTGIILSFTVLFVGCGNNIVKKSIEQAITAIDNKEYNKALVSLEIALEEDDDNKEAIKLYKIINSYEDANNAIEENKIDEAMKILDDIDSDYINYAIKDDIDNLKVNIRNYYKEIEKIDNYLLEAEALFKDKKYGDCKVYLGFNILGSSGDSIEENKYATKEQKQKALELFDKCEREIEAEEEAKRVAEEERLEKERVEAEQKKEEEVKAFTPEQAIQYVFNSYGDPTTGYNYEVIGELKNDGRDYYEVADMLRRGNGENISAHWYIVYEDGTIVKEF